MPLAVVCHLRVRICAESRRELSKLKRAILIASEARDCALSCAFVEPPVRIERTTARL
ncbi:Uncharacterised protein [Mycobacterium tuberculosis]|nr:Uncharacterised protein [Mycobacterium tuberculosis]COY24883.1 Uncharacterised protein [Mycobacterium tuberculosis]